MKKTVLLIIATIYCLTANADMPGPAYQYDSYSENGKFYFKSIPYYNFDQTDFGKTVIYESKTKKRLYKIDNYLPTASFISNNGKALVTITYWMWGHSDLEKQVLIKIYIQGKKPVKLFLNDFFTNKSKLKKTVSHTLWYNNLFVSNDILHILTLEDKVVRVNLVTGKIIDKILRKDCKLCNNIEKLKAPKTIFHENIKYPDGYIFPDLTSGKKFHKTLIKALGKTEVKEYDDCKYYISVYGTIDRLGNCEIFMLDADVDKKPHGEFRRTVSNWITKQKYKTNLIPKNCDKWVFEDFFYLK